MSVCPWDVMFVNVTRGSVSPLQPPSLPAPTHLLSVAINGLTAPLCIYADCRLANETIALQLTDLLLHSPVHQHASLLWHSTGTIAWRKWPAAQHHPPIVHIGCPYCPLNSLSAANAGSSAQTMALLSLVLSS